MDDKLGLYVSRSWAVHRVKAKLCQISSPSFPTQIGASFETTSSRSRSKGRRWCFCPRQLWNVSGGRRLGRGQENSIRSGERKRETFLTFSGPSVLRLIRNSLILAMPRFDEPQSKQHWARVAGREKVDDSLGPKSHLPGYMPQALEISEASLNPTAFCAF